MQFTEKNIFLAISHEVNYIKNIEHSEGGERKVTYHLHHYCMELFKAQCWM